MAIYFFIVITSIIIGLLVFAFSEPKENKCESARCQQDKLEQKVEKPTPITQHNSELTSAHLNH
jgi:hypothetical protein